MTTAPEAATSTFVAAYGHSPDATWCAPGRVNLIGEHTDYNEGFVLPFAIDRACRAAVGAGARTFRVVSAQQPGPPVEFDATPTPGTVPGWVAYVAGVVWALQDAGHDVPPLDIALDSTVPLGASLSSSAALECSVAAAIDDVLGLGLTRTQLALLAQRAENDFVGVPCGAMDQMASMHGQAGHVVFLDMRSMEVETVPFDPAAHGLTLLVIDTRAPHALVDGEYAARRRDCERAADLLGVRALRDLTLDDLENAARALPDERLLRRVRHVVTEDDRVLDLVSRMRAGATPRDVADLLTRSHASMRDDYDITVPHVDVAVDTALAAGAHGARMTGGGFGGSVIALTDSERAQDVVDAVTREYARHGFTAPVAFTGLPAQGARRLT